MGWWTARAGALALGGLLGIGAIALACGGEERTVETETGRVTVREEGEQAHVQGETREGTSYEGTFGEDVDVPDDFPDDVPLYPEAKVVGSMQVEESGRLLTLTTGDAPEKVMSFYRGKLESDGWQVESEMNMGGQRMLAAVKDERTVAVQAMEEESGSRVLLTVSQN